MLTVKKFIYSLSVAACLASPHVYAGSDDWSYNKYLTVVEPAKSNILPGMIAWADTPDGIKSGSCTIIIGGASFTHEQMEVFVTTALMGLQMGTKIDINTDTGTCKRIVVHRYHD